MQHNKNSWFFYICFFFAFSVIGWLCETCWVLMDWHKFVNRGFFYGPYLPIYGFGTTLVIVCFKNVYLNKKYLGKINIKPLLIFLYSFVVLSALEYFSSLVLEQIFHKRWWDYSYNRFNLHGRICLKNSIYFGLCGVYIMYFAYPFFKKLANHISKKILQSAAAVIILVMGSDFVLSVIRYLR